VAGFIGSPAMNFVPGHAARTAGAGWSFADGTLLPAPVRLQDGAGIDGQRVIYGVRPEHLALRRARPGLSDHGHGGNRPAPIPRCTRASVRPISSVFRERHDFAAGQALHLVPDHHHTHLFDAESGQALPRQTARQPPRHDHGGDTA
jgi:multiple sugar transport system ATP-binding protein